MVSIPFNTPQEKSTIIQMVLKAVFFHSEFGISAGLPDFSRHCIQAQKEGIRAVATQSKLMFSGSRMVDGLSVMLLRGIISLRFTS